MGKVKIENLRETCIEILKYYGVSKDDAEIVAESIEYAHTRGKHTHGIGRMPIYIRKLKNNLMNPQTPMNIAKEMEAVVICDAQNGFGQVAAIKGADIAMKKARKFGVGIVGIKNSNNFGTAGFIGEHIVNEGMIGVIFTNSAPAIAPTGGIRSFLGTNPICFAFPSDGENPPIIFDMACSNAARGKVRLAAKNGEKIPHGWAVDENGNDTTDPNEALKGSMIAMGGYKGYGLAICVDLLAGMLTGSGFAGEVKNLNHPTEISRYGHFIIALNLQSFLSEYEYKTKLNYFIRKLRSCGEEGKVLYPGEKSFLQAKKNEMVIEIKDNMIIDLNELAKISGIEAQVKILNN